MQSPININYKMPKSALRVLKKKILDNRILYKIEWSNGSISYEPFSNLEEEVSLLVERWEIARQVPIQKKISKEVSEKTQNRDRPRSISKPKPSSQLIKPKKEPVSRPDLSRDPPEKINDILFVVRPPKRHTGHLPRPSEPCEIYDMRKRSSGTIEFYVRF